jgi:hypothetical protein
MLVLNRFSRVCLPAVKLSMRARKPKPLMIASPSPSLRARCCHSTPADIDDDRVRILLNELALKRSVAQDAEPEPKMAVASLPICAKTVPRPASTGATATRVRRLREDRRGLLRERRPQPSQRGGRGLSKDRHEPHRDLQGPFHYPSRLRSNQWPPLPQRSCACHPGSAARRISIHSGVTPGRVASSSRASAFVWVTQGITAGASPSSGWQANSRRMPLGS